MTRCSGLRVALLAGTLERGGAEKQAVYMAGALRSAGAEVRVYTLAAGGHYEATLRELGITPVHVGRRPSPALRLLAFAAALRHFRPHVVQAAHFYANLYVALAARPLAALELGAIRSTPGRSAAANGRWGMPLLRIPRALIANSRTARDAAEAVGVPREALHVVRNVIALGPRAAPRTGEASPAPTRVIAAAVANLSGVKRIDRFLDALALARAERPELSGLVVGEGPEREALERRARSLGLSPRHVEFTGHSPVVREHLARADMLVLCSDQEGFPNVILEAMEAGLPVVTTPAGDAGDVVMDGVTGFVVPFDDTAAMAERMVRLGGDAALRGQLGAAGRARAEANYGTDGLADSLIAVYRAAAGTAGVGRVLEALPA